MPAQFLYYEASGDMIFDRHLIFRVIGIIQHQPL